MSRECMATCPRIQDARENLPEGAHPVAATAELVANCEATYDCDGPQPGEVEVVRGFIRRRTELKDGVVCGLSA